MCSEMCKIARQYLIDFLKSITHQLTGIVPFLLAFIIDIVFKVANEWIYYVVAIPISITIGGFNLYKEQYQEIQRLENELKRYTSLKPEVEIKVKVNGKIHPNPVLFLQPIPERPDTEKLVQKEKERLAADIEKQTYRPFGLGSLGQERNPNFEQNLDAYLVDYKNFLIKIWECCVNRANAINLLLDNYGGQPATDITLDLLMPPQYSVPEEHHQFNRETTPRDQIISHVEKPYAPKPFIDFSMLSVPINFPSVPSNLPPIEDCGPDYKQKEDGIHVIYKIDKLIQHSPVEDLEPFWIWLGSIEEEETWDIKVKITCAELQQPVYNTISIQIRKE